MNIRFSEDSIRVRVSLEEALSLQREGLLAAKLPSKEYGISLELIIEDQQTELLDFSFKSSTVQLLVNKQQLDQLIEAAPSRDSSLETQLETKDGTSAKLVLEIDLFSRKKKAGTKE